MPGSSREQDMAVPSPSIAREIIETGDAPDLYADEFWIQSSPVSTTLTLLVTLPPAPTRKSAPKAKVVARVRMSPQLAAELAKLISGQLQVVQVAEQAADGPKH
jgi:hypothetical protein